MLRQGVVLGRSGLPFSFRLVSLGVVLTDVVRGWSWACYRSYGCVTRARWLYAIGFGVELGVVAAVGCRARLFKKRAGLRYVGRVLRGTGSGSRNYVELTVYVTATFTMIVLATYSSKGNAGSFRSDSRTVERCRNFLAALQRGNGISVRALIGVIGR